MPMGEFTIADEVDAISQEDIMLTDGVLGYSIRVQGELRTRIGVTRRERIPAHQECTITRPTPEWIHPLRGLLR